MTVRRNVGGESIAPALPRALRCCLMCLPYSARTQLARLAVLAGLFIGTLGCDDDSGGSGPNDASASEDFRRASDAGGSLGPGDGAPSDRDGAGDGSASGDRGTSYAAVQALFASKSCGVFACHGTGAGTFSLMGRAWVELDGIGRPLDRLADWALGQDAEPCARPGQTPTKRVTPGSPENSYLLHALRGARLCAGGVRMPPDGPYLEEAEIQIVEKWIREQRP